MKQSFEITRSWLQSKTARESSALDATLSTIRISIGEHVVTAFTSDFEHGADELSIPSYPLAEWFAENWWALLWEPRKSEEQADSRDFLSRHSTLAAQHGFALPRIMFVHEGDRIGISCKPRQAEFAQARFTGWGQAAPPRDDVQAELAKFCGGTCQRLLEKRVQGTPLQAVWERIAGTREDEFNYCRLIGALGLSPYGECDEIDRVLEKFDGELSYSILLDTCLAAHPETVEQLLEIAKSTKHLTEASPAWSLSALRQAGPPTDSGVSPAWHRGVRAAKKLREHLHIEDTDPSGSTKMFDLLGIDPKRHSGANAVGESASITGMFLKDGLDIKSCLLQRAEPQRRFGAAREAFLAWTEQECRTIRCVTSALTRDQQASRAFAAEVTAPLAYLRKQTKRSRLSQAQVFDIADVLKIGPDVVWKQALNNGLEINSS